MDVMAPKKKNANKKGGNAAKEDDFDLDAILEAEGLKEAVPEPPKEEPKEATAKEEPAVQLENFSNVDDAAAAFLNSLSSQSAPSGGKKKNKKKKTGANATGEETPAEGKLEEKEMLPRLVLRAERRRREKRRPLPLSCLLPPCESKRTWSVVASRRRRDAALRRRSV